MDSRENRLDIPRHLISEKASRTSPEFQPRPEKTSSALKTVVCTVLFVAILIWGLKYLSELENELKNPNVVISTKPPVDGFPPTHVADEDRRKTCTTRGCRYLVENLKTWIDWKTSPCDNFYVHACGGYNPETYEAEREAMDFEAEAEKAMKSVEDWLQKPTSTPLSPSEKVFRTMYEKCAARGDADFEQLYEDVRYLLRWPFDPEDPDAKEEKEGILEYDLYRVNDILTKILRLHVNSLQLFHIEGERKELRITPTLCGNGTEQIDFGLVKPYLERIAEKIPSGRGQTLMTSGYQLAKYIDETTCSENKKHRKEGAAYGEYLKFDNYKGIDFEKILRAMWGFNQKGLLAKILQKTVFEDYEQFTDPESELNTVLQEHGNAVANWLVIKYIESFARREATLKELGCPAAVTRMLPRTALQIHVNHIARPANHQMVSRVLKSLKVEFQPNVAKIGPGKEKEHALLDKIANFETELGGLGTGKDVFLAQLPFNATGDSFYRLSTRLNRFAAKNAIDYAIWDGEMCMEDERTAARANFNRWVPWKKLLAPMLLDPLLDSDFPAAVNFGRAGSVIGREMGDFLNPRNAKRVKDHYWDGRAIAKFDRNAKCFLKASLDGSEEKPDYPIQRQIYADHFGVTAAWHAYKNSDGGLTEFRLPEGQNNISDDQLFFYSMIQMRCNKKHRYLYRDHARMNGILAQADGFADAFRCPVGTKMNPEAKCSFEQDYNWS